MEIKKVLKKLDRTLLFLLAMVLIAVAAAFWIGGWQLTISGLTQAGQLVQTVWLRLILGFILAGLVQVLIPHAVIAKWLGPTSGLKGLLIASYAGIILSGGPFVRLPIVASMYAAGAGVGPVIALLVSTQLIGFRRLITWDIPFLGAKMSLSRYVVCLFVPPLAGLVGGTVYQLLSMV